MCRFVAVIGAQLSKSDPLDRPVHLPNNTEVLPDF